VAVGTVARGRLSGWHLWGDLKSRAICLAYADTGKRDLRLDFLRGLAATAMVVDHVGGDTFLTALSGGNKFIVSAAEGFIFLSGVVLGMVYGDRIEKSGTAVAAKGMLKRAFTLYKASLGMALTFIALFLMTDLRLWENRDSGLGTDDPVQAVIGAFTLHYSYHGSDVMVMYSLMLLVAPAIIYLMYKGRTALVMVGSVALWALYQRFPQEAVFPWTVANSSFPFAAWQLLFVVGMAAGYHRERVTSWLIKSTGSARLTILASASVVYLLGRSEQLFGTLQLPSAWFGDATYASLFAKPDLGPGRVLAFLGIAVLGFTIVNSLWVPLKYAFGWFILPMGQNSLYVYIMHVFVLVGVYNLAPMAYYWTTADTLNTAAQLTTLGVVWIMVRTRFLFMLVPR
jgi:hypothetical protein